MQSLVYLPLGSIEFHSAHLPVGLDGLTAHGVCTRAAARTGGIVLPTLFYGVGGGHTSYPWTIMADGTDARHIARAGPSLDSRTSASPGPCCTPATSPTSS